MELKLVSFNLCPFVQRSVITLLEKGMDYDITYLTRDELENPPEWFTEISPLRKVPVLRVDSVSLFESAVICEYIDEIQPPSMHPSDPLTRALNRAWIKFGEDVLMSQFKYVTAKDEAAFKENQQALNHAFQQLEDILGDGPFFNGNEFCLVDAAFAPVFMRLAIVEEKHQFGFFDDKPKLAKWAEACLARDSVKNSVIPDLQERYLMFIDKMGGYLAKA